MKVLIKTLGCKANRYESDKIIDLFSHQFDIGHSKINEIENPDVLIINTCTVTHVADRKSRQAIASLKTAHPKAKVIAFGCGVNVDQKSYGDLSHVDYAIKDREKVEELLVEIAKEYPSSFYTKQNHRTRTRTLVKIQDGCDQFCTYCIIPKSRGRQNSRTLKEIIDEVNEKVDEGYKEIVLTGINIGTWREDEKDLAMLIQNILNETTIESLRLSSIEPEYFSEKFYKLFENPRFCPFLHLCLQSGSDKILKLMRRSYKTDDFLKIVEKLRKASPNIGLTTDIIVGFPGETEKEHKETLNFVKKIRFSKIHIFPYSKRTGTYAAVMKNQVNEADKKRRCSELAGIELKMRKQFYEQNCGKETKVLFETTDDGGYFTGYTDNYIRARLKTTTKKDLTNKLTKVQLIKVNENIEMLCELV